MEFEPRFSHAMIISIKSQFSSNFAKTNFKPQKKSHKITQNPISISSNEIKLSPKEIS
jgi:hypothetical protein